MKLTAEEKPKLSIIIPVYNEDQTVAAVIKKVLAAPLVGLRKEIIIVNDGSTDGTKEKVANIVKNQTMVKSYNSIINLGKGAAVRIGIAKSTGNIIIIQDADLELDPNEYMSILEPILSGRAKVVYGTRFKNKRNHIFLRTWLGNKILTMITNILFGLELTDMETAYKAFTKEVIASVRLRALGFEIEPELTARICQQGEKIVEVPISYQPRTVEEGKKIRLIDGIEAVFTLIRCRLTPL